MPPRPNTEPGALRLCLLQLREGAGLTGLQLADLLGWDNTKVSKIERHRQRRLTQAEVSAWAEKTGATEQMPELLRMLEDEQTQRRTWSEQGSAAAIQQDLDARTQASQLYQEIGVLVLPGLLQTEDYARCILDQAAWVNSTTSDVAEGTAARIARQAVLRQPGHKFELLFTEAALQTWVCPPDVMRGQLHHLSTSSFLPNVSIGIIPMRVPLQLAPVESFILFDGVADVETYTSGDTLGEDPSERRRRVFVRLWDQAVTGDAARALITDAAAALR